jgi:hypothetical protein
MKANPRPAASLRAGRGFRHLRCGGQSVGRGLPAAGQAAGELDPHDVLGFGAFRILNDVKLDCLAFGQRLESVTFEGGEVDEYIRSTFLLNEPKPFFLVEPFHGTACHLLLTSLMLLSWWGKILVEEKRKNRLPPNGRRRSFTHPNQILQVERRPLVKLKIHTTSTCPLL